MAALTDNRDTKERCNPTSIQSDITGGTSTEFYKGQMVMIDLADGRLKPVTSGSASTKQVVGRCEERYTSTATDTRTIKFKSGVFRWTNGSAFAAADVGDVCYASDDNTVGSTNTNPIAGRIVSIASDGVDVFTMWPLPQLAPIGPTGV